MRKMIVVLLAAAMVISLAACGGGSAPAQTTAAPDTTAKPAQTTAATTAAPETTTTSEETTEETTEDDMHYVGKYRMVKSSGYSDNDLAKGWENKSWFIWIEIMEDGTITYNSCDDIYVSVSDYPLTLEELKPFFDGDRIMVGTSSVFEKTDEIPENLETLPQVETYE